jgi:rhodanese-related sulfurtransferase
MGRHYRYTSGMPVKRVSAQDAAKLLAEGYKYLDVRSIPEFQQGHPPGAYNVPIAHMQPGGRVAPNADFATVVTRRFDKGDKIVVGCAAGNRSQRAAEMLAAAGWSNLVENGPGMNGWKSAGLPIETAAPGREYDDLVKG